MKNTFFDFKLFKVSQESSQTTLTKGNNQKGITILFSIPKEEEEVILGFVEKILKAIQLDLIQDTLIINITQEEVPSFQEIQKNKVESLILFGIAPEEMGIRFQIAPYHIVEHQGIQILWADAIKDIFEERQAGGKKMSGQLWKALQVL